MDNLPTIGSRWTGDAKKFFIVKAVVELEGNTWVHYGEENTNKEYSCWIDSFLTRFKEDKSYGTRHVSERPPFSLVSWGSSRR